MTHPLLWAEPHIHIPTDIFNLPTVPLGQNLTLYSPSCIENSDMCFTTGIEDTWVSAHLHPTTGILTAAIHTPDDVYYVEPSFRHFHRSHDFHMITYKQSHVKFNLTGYDIASQ